MRTWCSILILAGLAAACGDHPTEVVPDRELTLGPGDVAFATTSTEDGLTITTDKDDYQPGDTVFFTGSGWPANDVLDILLEDDPATHEPHRWTVNTDGEGAFRDSTYVVDVGDLGVMFTLTATSRFTGRSLVVQFTDGNPSAPLVTGQNPNPVPAGTPATYLVTVNYTGNSNQCTVTLSGSPLPPPNWPSAPAGGFFSFASPTLTGSGATGQDSRSTTLTVQTTGMAAGTYRFRVNAAIGASGCQGGDEQSAIISLVVVAANAAPLVDAGGPYSGNRNVAISLGGATATDGDGDALTYAWTYTEVSGVPAGTTCSFSNAAALNPTFTCTNVGLFKVTLTVNEGKAPAVADDAQVTVDNGAPTAGAGGDYTGNEGTAVSLTGSGTDPDNDPLTYKWTYDPEPGVDAGATCSFSPADTDRQAGVTCTDDGVFKLTLTVTDTDGKTGTAVANLTLANAKPVASAGGPYSGNEGEAITLAGSADDPGDTDDAGLMYLWSVVTAGVVDPSGQCGFDDATRKDAKVTCTDDSNAGKFTLQLVATDDDGGVSLTSEADLTVGNLPPTANAGGPYTGEEGSDIQLAGSADDPGINDEKDLTYEWTAIVTGIDGPDGKCTFDDATKRNAKVNCTDDSDDAPGGKFRLKLIARDDDTGTSTASYADLTVENAGPVAEAGGPYSGNEGEAVQLDGSVTDAGANDTHTWSWQYVAGAGLNGGSCRLSSATAQKPTITCTDNGTVELTLTVTDDDGDGSSDQATLTLANVPPVANAGGSYSGNEGAIVQLNGSATDVGSNDTHVWSWEYEPGPNVDLNASCQISSPTAEDPTIICTDDGTIKLTLTVTDDDGGSDTDQATLTLSNVNPTANAGGPSSGAEGSAIALTGLVDDAGDNDQLTQQWSAAPIADVDDGAGCSFSAGTALSTTVTCTDDGTYQLTLAVQDDDGGSGSAQVTLTVSNANPTFTAALSKQDGSDLPGTLIVAGTLDLKVPFQDPGTNDTHTAQIDCGTGVYSTASASGTPFMTSCSFATIGPRTIRVKVTDDDDGYAVTIHQLTVKYNFDGFYAPVDRPSTMNVSKAGQAIPLKWRLTDANGVPVTNLTTVLVKAVNLACSAGVTTDQIEEYAASTSGLLNLGDGRYQFNWKTPTNYASTCKSIALVFGAGGLSYTEEPSAYFSFKK